MSRTIDGQGRTKTVADQGAAGASAWPVSAASLPLPSGAATSARQDDLAAEVGATNESAASTDTSTSGLNGLLKRIAQRLTSLIGLLPGALTGPGNLKVSLQESNASQAVTNAGTFAVQIDAGAVTSLALLDDVVYAEDAASANADKGVMVLARRTGTPANTSGTDGDYEALQVSAGRLWVDASGKTLTVDGSGVTQPVSAASLPLPTGAATEATLGNAATNLGSLVLAMHAEDAAHVSGDQGFPAWAVRRDTAAQTAGSDGDYCALLCDASGRLHVAVGNAVAVTGTFWQATQPVSGTFWQATQPVSGTFWQATQPVSLASVPSHPVTNAGTFAVQADTELPAAAALADGAGNPTAPAVGAFHQVWNGSTWDRQQGTVEGTALASASRTASTNSADLTNYSGRGVQLMVNVTAAPGGQSLTFKVQAKDPVSGSYVDLDAGANRTTTGAVVIELLPGGGTTSGGLALSTARGLPRTWRVSVTHSGAGSWSYSVGYCLLP